MLKTLEAVFAVMSALCLASGIAILHGRGGSYGQIRRDSIYYR